MTLLYPSFLWFLIPLAVVFFTSYKRDLIISTHLFILTFLVLAVSRPAIEEGLQESTIEAKDIIIALDVSYSMKAKDIAPTRYDFAKKTIRAFLKENQKDNIMLIAFTTNPLLLSPPTTDHDLINLALKSLRPEYILTKGTSLKKLFAKVATMPHTNKDLILMSDGGEEEDTEALAEQLKNTDLRLTVLALGTKHGSTLEKENGRMLKDKAHNLVVSRINPMLKTLVSEVDGTYLTASATPETTAKALQNATHRDDADKQKIIKKQYRYTELYQFPLFLALILFLMLHTRASKYLLMLFAFLGVNLQASVWDAYHLNHAYDLYAKKNFSACKRELEKINTRSLQSQFALANTYYKTGSYKKAMMLYKAIRSTKAEIKQKLFYNIANAYTMLGEYDKAKIYYTKALQLGEDEEAQYNLSIVALLKKKQDASLGIAHPKSQNSDASKSDASQNEKEKPKTQDEDQPSSGSGSEGKHPGEEKKENEKEKKRLKIDNNAQEQPLSSKVYELINKGYIRETQPW